MPLLPPTVYAILTPTGFHNEVEQLRQNMGLSRQAAYEEVERSHQIIAGEPRYKGGFKKYENVVVDRNKREQERRQERAKSDEE